MKNLHSNYINILFDSDSLVSLTDSRWAILFHNPQSSCSAHDNGHLIMIGTVLCQVTALRRSGSGHYRTSCQSLTMVSSVTRTLYKRNTFTSGCWNGSTFHRVSFRTKCWHLFTDSQRYLFISPPLRLWSRSLIAISCWWRHNHRSFCLVIEASPRFELSQHVEEARTWSQTGSKPNSSTLSGRRQVRSRSLTCHRPASSC